MPLAHDSRWAVRPLRLSPRRRPGRAADRAGAPMGAAYGWGRCRSRSSGRRSVGMGGSPSGARALASAIWWGRAPWPPEPFPWSPLVAWRCSPVLTYVPFPLPECPGLFTSDSRAPETQESGWEESSGSACPASRASQACVGVCVCVGTCACVQGRVCMCAHTPMRVCSCWRVCCVCARVKRKENPDLLGAPREPSAAPGHRRCGRGAPGGHGRTSGGRRGVSQCVTCVY